MTEATWDKHTDRRIARLHPSIREDAAGVINYLHSEYGKLVRVTSTLRTFDEQRDLFDQGRSKPGSIVTDAEPGASYHNYGLAFDVVEILAGACLWRNQDWEKIGEAGERFGFVWGGRWSRSLRDRPHFQVRSPPYVTELARVYYTGTRDDEGYVNLAETGNPPIA